MFFVDKDRDQFATLGIFVIHISISSDNMTHDVIGRIKICVVHEILTFNIVTSMYMYVF